VLDRYSSEYPPILTLAQAAKLLQLRPGTVKNKLSRGEFRTAVSRGKPLRFWRDRLVHDLFKNQKDH
jgi:hypothetical protein